MAVVHTLKKMRVDAAVLAAIVEAQCVVDALCNEGRCSIAILRK